MSIKSLFRYLYFKIIGKSYRFSSENYLHWLRKKGIKVGENVIINNPTKINIDISRPELFEIGNNVLLHSGTTILTHDFASRAFITAYNEFLPSHAMIKIGNNVWLGENVSILKGVTIGDNVIIGYGSIVTKSIPSNSVAIGIPAKVICTFDEYFKKRQTQYVDEAIDYAIAIYNSGHTPKKEDFYDDYPAFVDGSNWHEYNYPYSKIFTPEQFEHWKQNHKAPYHGWEEFMKAVNERRLAK